MTIQEKYFLFTIAAYIILLPLFCSIFARKRGKILSKPKFKCDNIWFPCFTWILEWFYEKISIGYKFNNWNRLRNKFLREPAISEIYLFVFFTIGAVWIILIEYRWYSFLTNPYFLGIGAGIAFYRPLEILLFYLHWLFVAKGRVESYRRSLACSIINLFEIGIYSTIVYLLLDWFKEPMGRWEALRLYIFGAFSIESFYSVKSGFWPQLFTAVKAMTSWIIGVLILGNVVSAISRGEKNYYPIKRCAIANQRDKKRRE